MKEPRTILALDVASTTGVAEWEPGMNTPRFYNCRFAGPGDEHKVVFGRARRWIDDRLSVGDISALYVEAPASPGAMMGHTTAVTVARLIGLWAIVCGAADVWRVPYRDVSVSTVRMAFLGHGRLKSAEAKARALAMALAIGWLPETLDEADAAALLYYAMTRECPSLAPAVSPMLQARVATSVENARILRDHKRAARRVLAT
jgi:hypothetical protein